MSQSVDKLKELLFQPESEAIATLSNRIDAVFARAGTKERFQASVATVLDGALRDAEVARHEEVATAIAPLIVKTVKTEIRNSTDDLVEALYPATGRMVKAYVASAIKDLTDEINRRLEANPFMLRLNALLSGRSAGELAIAQSQRLTIEDMFLIRRATGALVARWPEGPAGSSQDHVLGGVLTAINEFTAEAFKAEGSALRQIDLGGSRVYLRVSPTYLLAAKCTGSAPVAAEQLFDEVFLSLLDGHHAALDSGRTADATPLLRDLSQRLETRLHELQPDGAAIAGGIKPLPVLLTLIALPLLAWFAWGFYVDYRIGRIHGVADNIIASHAEMQGYPVDLKVRRQGRVLAISGLAPSDEAKSRLLGELHAVLPEVEVVDQLSAVPVGGPDVRPAIAALRQDQAAFVAASKAEVTNRQLARAIRALERTRQSISEAALAAKGKAVGEFAALETQAQALSKTLAGIDVADAGPAGTSRLAAAADEARRLAADLHAKSLAGLALSSRDDAAPAPEAALAQGDPADRLAESAERAAMAARALLQLSAVRQRLEDETLRFNTENASLREEAARLRAQIAAIPPTAKATTPREELERFARSHAIFFTGETAFRDEASAARTLDQLADLMKRDTSLLRILGYTDDAGTPAKNNAVSQARADAVASALKNRGVPSGRLVTLKRTSPELAISPVAGAGSVNRRVEFEVGFLGEGGE